MNSIPFEFADRVASTLFCPESLFCFGDSRWSRAGIKRSSERKVFHVLMAVDYENRRIRFGFGELKENTKEIFSLQDVKKIDIWNLHFSEIRLDNHDSSYNVEDLPHMLPPDALSSLIQCFQANGFPKWSKVFVFPELSALDSIAESFREEIYASLQNCVVAHSGTLTHSGPKSEAYLLKLIEARSLTKIEFIGNWGSLMKEHIESLLFQKNLEEWFVPLTNFAFSNELLDRLLAVWRKDCRRLGRLGNFRIRCRLEDQERAKSRFLKREKGALSYFYLNHHKETAAVRMDPAWVPNGVPDFRYCSFSFLCCSCKQLGWKDSRCVCSKQRGFS
ncbi:hypothetical protein L596_023932 [Steinernema carpocapsae]|uniref:Uncharacterized protein n=1 Tax=Steinernema carpocapsae TaxID=34508 RepID=A0A4U5MF79_STECR|nr:hypothetical protein L596_023932 [Steinernema carpocapsae]